MRDTLSPYDLMFCIGSDVLRMSVYSETDPMPEGMAVVQLGLRDWEMGKNYPAEIALRADVKETLAALAPVIERKRGTDGAENAAAAMAALAERLSAPCDAVESVGWQGDALEAQAFGYLAVRSRRGLALSLPRTTGVPHPVSGGVFHPAPRRSTGAV